MGGIVGQYSYRRRWKAKIAMTLMFVVLVIFFSCWRPSRDVAVHSFLQFKKLNSLPQQQVAYTGDQFSVSTHKQLL